MVVELLTFSGSRHLAKYYADSSSECSFTLKHIVFCMLVIDTGHPVESSDPQFACIEYFCSWCRVGLCSKQVQHSL